MKGNIEILKRAINEVEIVIKSNIEVVEDHNHMVVRDNALPLRPGIVFDS